MIDPTKDFGPIAVTCLYNWTEWDEKKGESIKIYCGRNTWHGSRAYCIFHDPSPKKDLKLLRRKLKEKLDSEDYNFHGYYFPGKLELERNRFNKKTDFGETTFENVSFKGVSFENVSFSGAEFKSSSFIGNFFKLSSFEKARFHHTSFNGSTFRRVSFWGAHFEKNATFAEVSFDSADFRKTTFKEDTFFDKATFQSVSFKGASLQENAYFNGATFKDNADFSGTVFKSADFRGATFQDADFSGASFERNLEFGPKAIEKLNLQNSQFLFRGRITADLTQAKFFGANLENVIFIGCKWPEEIFEA